jgi:hypothetical protein
MFVLHFFAIFLISLTTPKENKKIVDFLSTADGLRRLILQGDLAAAEDLLASILSQNLGLKIELNWIA